MKIIPLFKIHDFFKGINGYAPMFYPLIGLILGGGFYLVHFLLTPCFPAMHLNILVFVLWLIITGGLHLDGFSDTLDGLFVPKDRAVSVMSDPHAGGRGVIISIKQKALRHFYMQCHFFRLKHQAFLD